jgi:diguanylate cyclase (GGDEF)-like protein
MFSDLFFHPWLAVLGALMAVSVASLTLANYPHLLAKGAAARRPWLLLAGACTGVGIWAALFLATLARDWGLPLRFDIWWTLASLASAIFGTVIGLGVSLHRRREMIAAGGAIVGVGAVAAQWLGFQAFVGAGQSLWQPTLVALSVVAGPVVMAGAMLAYREQTGWRALLSGAALFTAGIGLAHLLGMAARTIVPAASADPVADLDGTMLGIAIAGMATVVVLAGHAVALVDQRAIRENSSRIDELIDAAAEGLVIANDGVIVNMNARVLKLAACSRDALIGKDIFGDLLTVPSQRSGGKIQVYPGLDLLTSHSTAIPVEVIRRRIDVLSHGNEVYAIRDLRELEQATHDLNQTNQKLHGKEQELHKGHSILAQVVRNISQGLCIYDDDQAVVICNERYATIYGLPADAIQTGLSLRNVLQKRIESGVYSGSSPRSYMESHVAPAMKAEDKTEVLNTGQVIAVTRRPLSGGGWLTIHQDITERIRMEEQIAQSGNSDPLTNLPSRTSLRASLGEILTKAGRQDRRIAVVALGIDRFNKINDALGHGVGDDLLQIIAKRLQDNTRQDTLLGRFSDDKFIVAESIDDADRAVELLVGRIQEHFRKPFVIEGVTLEIGATIGISMFPADGTDADTLLKSASLALHKAKAGSRGSHCFFKPAMQLEIKARHALEQDVSKALEKREFEIHYQPIVDLQRNEITGFEAFLRWQHPSRGLIPPGTFLPVAEEMGLLNPIEEWALQQACKQAMQWPKTYSLAVNLSLSRFQDPKLPNSIGRTLAETGFTADRLQLEITERVLHDNAAESLKILQQLFGLGVRVVLDDFGAGFASLTYLRQFPFYKLKIDRSFVARAAEGDDARLIIRTLARLGTGLRLATAAEGVETKEQLDIVRAEGCTEMQGHYFSPPKTAEDIGRLLLLRPLGKADVVAPLDAMPR